MISTALISIIVPVYNVELYLDTCISSLIDQSYKNIEIILIDDGSTDGSAVICDYYAKLDHRVIVVHQNNSGVSMARNKGIEISSGEFLMFVDSDDYIHPKICEILLNTIKRDKSDIVFSRYLKTSRIDEKFNEEQVVSSEHLSIKDSLNKIIDLNYPEGVNAVAKLYKAPIVKKHGFKQGYPLGEDQEFIFSVILDCNTISFIDAILYFYVYRENSAGHNRVNVNNEMKLFEIYNQIQSKLESQNYCNSNFIIFRMIQSNLTSLNNMIKSKNINYDFAKTLCCDIRNNTFTILSSNFKEKKFFQLLIAGWCFPIYRIWYGMKS